eukprot:49419_1
MGCSNSTPTRSNTNYLREISESAARRDSVVEMPREVSLKHAKSLSKKNIHDTKSQVEPGETDESCQADADEKINSLGVPNRSSAAPKRKSSKCKVALSRTRQQAVQMERERETRLRPEEDGNVFRE